MGDLLRELADDAADLRNIPSDQGSARLRKLGGELMRLDREIERLTERLEKAQKRHTAICTVDMPALMDEVGQDKIGIPGRTKKDPGVDLELKPYHHANIQADWEPNRRKESFRYLARAGGGDLIKSTIVMAAGREQWDKMRRIANRLRQMMAEEQVEASLELKMDAPWNSLTAWMREQLKGGKVLDLEKIGGTVGQVVKIKKRRQR